MTSKNIVIVGGGSAGTELAIALSAKLASTQHTITLISDKEYYPHYIASLRTVSRSVDDKEWSDRTFFSLEHIFVKGNGKSKFVFGKAVSIEYDDDASGAKKFKSGKVVTDKGDSVPFDVLAITTGSIWEGPLEFKPTKPETLQHVTEWREKIRDAKGVVLAGGGAVGIELCGEIRDQYPSKPITLVHNLPLLLNPRYPDKFRRDLATRLAKRNIHVILDDSINVEEQEQHTTSGEVVTSKNVRIENADLLIPTRGPKPNSALFETLNPIPLTPSKYADIEPTFQLKGHPSIFALGDAIRFGTEIPQKVKHPKHAAHVIKNLLEILEGREPTAQYTPMFEGLFVTIGKDSGAAHVDVLWGLTFGNWVVSKLKGKELFHPQVRKALNIQDV